MVERFFFGMDGTSRDRQIEAPYILISAASLWNGKKFKKATFNDKVEEIFLDSGGFSFFTKWSRYPFTTDQYLQFVRDFCEEHPETKYVAVMDYPCEEYVNRADLMSNYQRIDETLKNEEVLIHREIPAKWVSVVQGHCYEEYFYCCEEMRKRGLWTELTGIGSICTRKHLFEISHILRMIRKKHTQVKLHAFGLKYNAIAEREIWDILYSVDSGAWRLAGDETRKKKRDWRPRHGEMMDCFKRYQEKVDALFQMRNGNHNLNHFMENCGMEETCQRF